MNLTCQAILRIITEHLSARLLIVQRSQFTFVCICIHHTLIALARFFFWSRPQTTNHVVLVWPGGDRKIVRMREPKWSRGHMVLVRPGGDRRLKKIVRKRKWSMSSPSVIVLESEDGNKETLHQKRVRQRRKVWRILARHFAHFLKLTVYGFLINKHGTAPIELLHLGSKMCFDFINLANRLFSWSKQLTTTMASSVYCALSLLKACKQAHLEGKRN